MAQASGPSTIVPGLSSEQLQRLLALIEPSPDIDKLSGKLQPNVCWLLDSGASHHMTGNISLLHNVHAISPSRVGLPNGDNTTAIKDGTVTLQPGLVLHHVLYVPNLAVNLVSISKLISDADCCAIFTDRLCILQDRTTRSPIGLGESHRGCTTINQSRWRRQHLLWFKQRIPMTCGIVG